MRLEEIAERLGSIRSVRWEEETCGLEDDIRTAIAERALPVTREWLLSIGQEWNASGDVDYVFIGEAGGKNVLVSCGEKCFIVWHCIGSAVCHVETRGQLLDLLSGLGVTK